jgi:hypothetical protein
MNEGSERRDPVHARGGVVAVVTPERRVKVALRVTGLAVPHAAAVWTMAGGAEFGIAPGAAGGVGRCRLPGERWRVLPRVAVAVGLRRQRREVGKDGAHLGTVLGQRAAVHRTHHAAVDPVGERLRAAAGQSLRVLRRNSDQREAVGAGAGVHVAVLAGEIVARKASPRVTDLGAEDREGLRHDLAAIVGGRERLSADDTGKGEGERDGSDEGGTVAPDAAAAM